MYSNDKQGLWHAWLSATLTALSQWPGALRSKAKGLWLQVALPLMLGCALLVAASAASAATETVTYIHTDVSGSPLAATDSNGAVVWKESYRAYGERWLQQSGTAQQTQWFHGKEQDAGTGLQYFGARYYDPAIGRFLGVDPVDFQDGNLHSFNRFAYGKNNPNRYVDPDGRFPLPLLAPIIWSATGAVASGALNAGAQKLATNHVRWGGLGGIFDAASEGLILGPIFGSVAAKSTLPTAEAGSIRGINSIGGNMNCVNCAIATDAVLAGRATSAMPGGPYSISVLEKYYGSKFGAPGSIDSITNSMVSAGHGARGIVYGSPIQGKGEVGHVFNVINQNGIIRYLDGQIGGVANTGAYKEFRLLRSNQ